MSNFKLPDPAHPIYYPRNQEDLENLRLLHRKMVRPQHVALHAIIPGLTHMSPSRSVMSIHQAAQHLVWGKMEKPVVLTGVEYEFGKYAFADEMPEDGEIIAVIPRYPRSSDPKTIRNNPETIVFYMRADQTLDYFSIKAWGKYHSHFGYTKRFNEKNLSLLTEHRFFPKGTKFAESPGVAEDGCYMMGLNANVAYVDDERLAEDGMVFRKGFVDDKLVVDLFEEIETGVGSKNFAINMWGSEGEYVIFPEIGDFIRHDGVVMVKRKYNALNSPVQMSSEALRSPDGIADEFVYSRPTAIPKDSTPSNHVSGEIVDIIVIRNPKAKRQLPPTMSGQLERYALVYQTFQNNLLKVEQRLLNNVKKKDPNGELKMTPRTQILLKRARGITSFGASRLQGPIEFQSHRARMDEWTIQLVIKHRRTTPKGDKFTGLFGDKGVTVNILPDEDFPEGTDIMVGASSTIGRTNLNRSFIPRIATAAVDLTKEFKEAFNVKGKVTSDFIAKVDPEKFDQVWERLMKFYAICSPILYELYVHRVKDKQGRIEHLKAVLNEVIHPLTPVDNPVNDVDVIIHLEQNGFLKPYKCITYRNCSGNIETSKNPVPVLSTYIEFNDKIAEDGSAVSFGKVQHHGLPASRTNSERYQFNFRNVFTRNIGQHESEILNHDSRSPALIAELLDRSNNPEVMMEISRRLMTDPTPTNIWSLVDRTKFPLNELRPRQFLRHFFETQGMKPTYMPEEQAASLPNLEKQHNDSNPV